MSTEVLCVWLGVVKQTNTRCPRLVQRNAAVQTLAHGSRPDSGRMQEVSWMKYDLNVGAEMGNITLDAYSICHHALKIQWFITPALWCIWENFNVYRCGLSHCCDVGINITQAHCCFSLWTQHAEWITQILICLPRLLSRSAAKQQVYHCALWDFVQLERQRKSLFFSRFFSPHFQSRDVALTIDPCLSEWCH